MTRGTLRSLAAAFSALVLLPASVSAGTLTFAGAVHPSFWFQGNWAPPALLDGSSTLVLDGPAANPLMYLGDASAGLPVAARQVDVRAMQVRSGAFQISYGPQFAGGAPGQLNFVGSDPLDPGVGLRIGGAGALADLTLFGASTHPASAAVVIDGASSSPARLQLANPGGAAATFHATSISVAGDEASLALSGNQRAIAQSVQISTTGAATPTSHVDVSNGARLDAGVLALVGGGDAVAVRGGILNATVRAAGPGTGGRMVFLDGGSGNLALDAQAGGQIAVGTSGSRTALTIWSAIADASSRIGLDFNNSDVLIDVAASTTNGEEIVQGVDLTARSSTILGSEPTFVASTLQLLNGSRLEPISIGVDASQLTIAEGSSAFAAVTLIHPTTSSVSIDGSNGFGPSTLRSQVIDVGSDLILFNAVGVPPQTGGDLPSAQSARLDLRNGAEARTVVRGIPFPAPMLLAIGSQGEVTLDDTSGIYVGDRGGAIVAGKIVLDQGGNLWGTGEINGVSFASGTHLDVFNTGGVIHPGFSPGRLTIGGSYTQQDGVLELSIGGSTPASGFSQLAASDGIAITGGAIRFVREAGYTGDLGATLQFLVSANGVVSVAPGVSIVDETGLGLAFDFATGSARITQVVPEAPVAALLAAGCAGLGWIGRRRRA